MIEPDATLRDEIVRTVEAQRDATVRLLQDLVRVPSVTGDEGAVQEVVADAFRESGLAVELCEATPEQVSLHYEHVGVQTRFTNRPNVIGIRGGSGGGRALLLNAHMDTVENGDPGAWTHDPLSGDVAEGRLYGRGSCDMKGGLATFVAALRALEELGIELGGDVTVAATVGEEDGGVGALATVLDGYRGDAALITEPTRLALVPAQAGSIVFRLKITGSAVHAAVRHRGVSAFEKFVPIFEDLRSLERERTATLYHPLFDGMEDKVPINVGVVRSGNWAVTVPESLEADVRVGMIPGEEVGPLQSLIEERIMAVADLDPWLREHPPEIKWFGGQTVPVEVPLDAPICEAVMRAHERATGDAPAVEGVSYGADMRLFIHFGQMPCVMYGAGDVGWAHGADEHIIIDDLLTASKTIACLLVDWCGVAGRSPSSP
jgi:acetylornithine deacetylase